MTTEWEFRGNAHADKFAKLGAAEHGVGVEQYQLWQGFKFLAQESARWAACVHVESDGQDHEDLMEAYWKSRGSASVEDPEAPEAPDDLEAEPQASDGGGGVGSSSLVGYGVADGWEEYADASFWWRGHNLLEAEVLSRTAHVSTVVFCCRCGTVASDGKLTTGLTGWCPGKARAGGVDQLRRIKKGEFPSYRANVRFLQVGRPHGVLPATRSSLAEAEPSLPPEPQPTAPSVGASGGWGRADMGGRAEVLKAFGLWEGELEQVRDLGRSALQRNADGPDEGESDAEPF